MGAGDNYISLYFDTSNGVRFNNVASVIDGGADVSATNGIVHVIDAVIGLPSVVDHALANPNFSNLTAALGAADGNLVDVLSSAGPFTVLAPGNMAFGEFLTDNNFSGLGDVPTDALANVLLNHVLTGVTTSTDLVNAESGYTSTNAMAFDDHMMSLYFNASNGVMFNGKAMVVAADVVGTNGIIHAVDAVIGLPTVVEPSKPPQLKLPVLPRVGAKSIPLAIDNCCGEILDRLGIPLNGIFCGAFTSVCK